MLTDKDYPTFICRNVETEEIGIVEMSVYGIASALIAFNKLISLGEVVWKETLPASEEEMAHSCWVLSNTRHLILLLFNARFAHKNRGRNFHTICIIRRGEFAVGIVECVLQQLLHGT